GARSDGVFAEVFVGAGRHDGHAGDVVQQERVRAAEVHHDRVVVGRVDAFDVFVERAVLCAVLLIKYPLERVFHVGAREVRAVMEGDVVTQVEGEGEAVVAEVPVGGQARNEAQRVVVHDERLHDDADTLEGRYVRGQ